MNEEQHVAMAISSAIAIANSAHYGQVDKAGAPYILHPMRVMLRMRSPEERIVAILHDVIEDTRKTPEPWTLDRIRKFFPDDAIIGALDAITRREIDELVPDASVHATRPRRETYVAYIRRLAENPLARRVKVADLRDNTDPRRPIVPGSQAMIDRYQWAIAYLHMRESGHPFADRLPDPPEACS